MSYFNRIKKQAQQQPEQQPRIATKEDVQAAVVAIQKKDKGGESDLNSDGSFKGGFDGCVAHMEDQGHDTDSAKRICGYINAHVRGGGPVTKQEVTKRAQELGCTDLIPEEWARDPHYFEVMKYHNYRDDSGRFVCLPAGAQGPGYEDGVDGPRSGDNKGAPDDGSAPTSSVDGPRSGENKGLQGNGGAPAASPPEGHVQGPRSGENKALPDNGTPPKDTVTGPRSGENKAVPDNGSAPQSSVTGPRSGENKATDGSNAGGGSVTTTQGTQGAAAAAQPKNTAPAALMANSLRRGTRVVLKNGYEARLEDNKLGDTRLATVYGNSTFFGSVNVQEIQKAQVGGVWHSVEVAKKDNKRRWMY